MSQNHVAAANAAVLDRHAAVLRADIDELRRSQKKPLRPPRRKSPWLLVFSRLVAAT